MAQLIDTSVFIDLERRGGSLEHLAGEAPDEAVTLASITASELLIGVHRADSVERRKKREAFVEGLLDLIPVVPFDLEVARTHAEITAALARSGGRIGAHDLIIAATALTHDYSVLTGNLREFGRVPGLRVVQPTSRAKST
jgi:tRNA(fMet)-specific endonuclease VapC